MSLEQLKSQINDLQAQAAGIQKRMASTHDSITNDNTLSDIGKRAKLNTDQERARTQLTDLRKKETELVAAKKQSLEKLLFGLSSSDPNQIIAYRDAQDRAGRITNLDDAREMFSRATLSGDKTLAAALLGRALENEWNSIVDEYVKQNPAAGDALADLAEIQRYNSNSFMNGLSYIA
jgi:hypothetical protein